ncbi:transmembrane protein 53-B isoform X2 [Procambarus clarkii]|uniref:transmembrane protein 53-B isoform X2 n=1 Tax=Procambarus clarkii TaxID=6728 RepID=UPI0037440859
MLSHGQYLMSRMRTGICFAAAVMAPRAMPSSCTSIGRPQQSPLVMLSLIQIRDFHSRRFSRNIEFFTASDVPLPKNTMEMASTLSKHDRPLTLLFCWLMARERYIKKYAQLYTNMGCDVLKIRISPFDLLRPTKGSQVAADQVLQFLHANPSHNPLLIHGLSVGGYVAMELMVKIQNNMQKHGHLLNRFVGQIWDSGVDIEGIPIGVPRAITNNQNIQNNIKKYLLWYLKVQYNTATIHYERASAKMHENFVGVPALLFFSENDPISTPEMNANVYKKWEARNFPVYIKCWKDSTHVSHYMKYRTEYEEEVAAFLERIGIIEPTRQRASSC